MSLPATLATAAFILAAAWLCTRYDAGTGLTWHDARRKRDGGPLAWALWGLLIRSRRVCPANAHGALIWHTRPRWAIGEDRACREDRASNGACWCGKRGNDGLRPASPVAGPDRTALAPPAGAVRQQWTVAPKGRHHAAAPRLGLVFDPLAGRIRHAETGPMQIPAGYGRLT